MVLFLTWMGILAAALGAYAFFLWRSGRHHARFRMKLTLLFILLILVPSIPLTFLSASLLSRSAETLFLPQILNTLQNTSAMLQQREEKTCGEFVKHPSESWNKLLLEQYGLSFACVIGVENKKPILETRKSCGDFPASRIYHWISARPLSQQGYVGFIDDSLRMLVCISTISDSERVVTGQPVSRSYIEMRSDLTQAIRNYGTLGILQNRLTNRNLVWIAAIIWIFLLGLITILIAGSIAGRISRPLYATVEGMDRIAKGDLDIDVEDVKDREFGVLIRSFKAMAGDLKKTRELLIQSERIAAWQGAARRISHEIKNCLTPVLISVNRLQKLPENSGSAAQTLFNSLNTDLSSLDRMSKYFSEFAKMPPPQKTVLDVNILLRSVGEMVQNMHEQAEIEYHFAQNLPGIQADNEQLRRAFHNLMKNGIEASSENPKIVLETLLSEPKKEILIHISDNGAGIDKEMLAKIGTPFITTKTTGQGLGLAIVNKIVLDHQGTMNITSNLGEGTIATITLPVT